MINELLPIVIENGSRMCRAGFAGDDMPQLEFHTIVGYQKSDSEKFYVGEDAEKEIRNIVFKYPIDRGKINNLSYMEKVWDYVFEKLLISPDQHPILFSKSNIVSEDFQQISEIMFEKYHVPALYVPYQGQLALISTGRTSGMVLDSGEGISEFSAFLDGKRLKGSKSVNLSGKDVTDCLLKELKRKDYSFTTAADREEVRKIKEDVCLISKYKLDEFNEEKYDEEEYVLPNGEKIKIGK
jgi:actin beta/gamma 1